MLVNFVSFVSLTQAKIIGEEGTLTGKKKKSPSDRPVDKSIGHFLDYRWVREVGGAMPRQVVLETQESTSVNSLPQWLCFSACLQVSASTSCPNLPQ